MNNDKFKDGESVLACWSKRRYCYVMIGAQAHRTVGGRETIIHLLISTPTRAEVSVRAVVTYLDKTFAFCQCWRKKPPQKSRLREWKSEKRGRRKLPKFLPPKMLPHFVSKMDRSMDRGAPGAGCAYYRQFIHHHPVRSSGSVGDEAECELFCQRCVARKWSCLIRRKLSGS